MKRPKPTKRPELRLDPLYGWPLRGREAPGDEDRDVVSDALLQALLDWAALWRQHTDAEGSFESEAAEAEHVQRGRGLQQRLQRELDRPVAFRDH